MPKVYLAGPISNCTVAEANEWRRTMILALDDHGITGISPLRCEPLIGERYAASADAYNADPCFGTARAIASKNLHDVRSCDFTLAYMPKHLPFSKGTLCELAWAFALGKPTILVTDDPGTAGNPVVQACAGWILTTLDEARDVLIGVLGDYANGAV
jgi:nucleoside 2-deoxyribosyltransferase